MSYPALHRLKNQAQCKIDSLHLRDERNTKISLDTFGIHQQL